MQKNYYAILIYKYRQLHNIVEFLIFSIFQNFSKNTRVQHQKIIENQNAYIDLLRGQLETSQKQLDILKNLFASTEDGVAVEKEIMKIIQANIDEKHPLWEYVKDKGGDVAVAGVLQWGPVIWTALKTYLATQGILIP